MLEAAVVMPVAISLMVGCVEFGNLFLTYGTANKSVRDAARYLARIPKEIVCSTGATGGLTIAQNLAIYGNASGTGTPLIPTTSTITFPGTCPNPVPGVTDVTVQAVVPYRPLMIDGIPFTPIQFGNRTVIHRQLYDGSPPAPLSP